METILKEEKRDDRKQVETDRRNRNIGRVMTRTNESREAKVAV